MALVYECAWRGLHALLHIQRTLVSWFRTRIWNVNWRFWKRALATLFFPVTLGLHNHIHRTLKMGKPTIKRGYRRFAWGLDPGSLEKLPQHVGFLIAEEEPSYKDIANLIVWWVFRRNHAKLSDKILKQQQELLGLGSSKYTVTFLNSSNEKPNHQVLSCQMEVRVLSADDGRLGIVRSAEQLCRAVELREKASMDIDVSMLDSMLRDSQKHIPDPDLVLGFGPVRSTLGFLPWHIHLTEFISLPSHIEISYEDFYGALQRYATCEQRQGK
ncbi:hypothetical protein JZ751_002605 [Albula glossodonta]|uniref:ditrans,polycis-polyprenyl diphosphate synthase [(2E,6E)-farnesyldiphosphate specific] n=1 Tax=Albula glossodonta TaxID=121402 RepID=A0A8T2NEZ8_9TELE|nr:hypothetical protein JZ751_002605 [Albula glossodonta]